MVVSSKHNFSGRFATQVKTMAESLIFLHASYIGMLTNIGNCFQDTELIMQNKWPGDDMGISAHLREEVTGVMTSDRFTCGQQGKWNAIPDKKNGYGMKKRN